MLQKYDRLFLLVPQKSESHLENIKKNRLSLEIEVDQQKKAL